MVDDAGTTVRLDGSWYEVIAGSDDHLGGRREDAYTYRGDDPLEFPDWLVKALQRDGWPEPHRYQIGGPR